MSSERCFQRMADSTSRLSLSPRQSQREINYTRKKREYRDDLLQRARVTQAEKYQHHKQEIFDRFVILQHEKARLIDSIPLEEIGMDLRRKLIFKMEKYILHSRDFNLSKIKQFELNLPKLIRSLKDQDKQAKRDLANRKSVQAKKTSTPLITTQTSKLSRNMRDDELSDSMAEMSNEDDKMSSAGVSKQAADKNISQVGSRSPQKKSMLRIMPISK